MIRNITLTVLYSLFFFSHGFGQSASIEVRGGSGVFLIFNSLKRYDQGVVLDNWTKVTLNFNAPTAVGWELRVSSSTATIEAEEVATDLDLSSIELRATIVNSNDPTIINKSPVVLSQAGDVLLSGSGNTAIAIDLEISYDCGTNAGNRMLGKSPDNYVTTLVLTLVSVDS